MPKSTLIKNALITNEGASYQADIRIEGQFIAEISQSGLRAKDNETVIDIGGKWLFPGIIDDQVHFREPGLTHKGDIASESMAALAGGVTSFMEMPNVNPLTINVERLEEKMAIGAARSNVNYSFFLGATNNNLDDLLRINPKTTSGIKIFMGSSTGDMLVDDENILASIFEKSLCLIATHCESETRIRRRLNEVKYWYGEDIPPEMHPVIRDEETCYASSSYAVELAKKYGTRLHILHISTQKETSLFSNDIPLRDKKITSEVCVHHLHFSSDDYAKLGNLIKCNPAIKAKYNRSGLWTALLDDRLDIIATDHAPHTWEEKQRPYGLNPSGLPLVQHSLQMMLEFAAEGKISKEKVVQKMCHAPADCFRVVQRGYLREGYYADMVVVDPAQRTTVTKDNILYKCGWSPLEGKEFHHIVEMVFVNGTKSWDNGFSGERNPMRLEFDR